MLARALSFALAIMLLFGCASSGSQPGKTQSKMIDVGGHSLYFSISQGSPGAPIVLLEAGQGADSSSWAAVQQQLSAKGYTVISYDRAGFGKSEMDSENYSIAREVSGLESGLQQLGVNGNIIYVAHSYGALLAQEYSARNPGKVRAIVLADPNNVCFNDNGGLSAVWSPPPYNVSAANQRVLYAYSNTIAEMRAVPPYPRVPTVVITSGKPPVPANLTALWRECHQKLVAGNPQGEYWIAENSSHLIPLDDPGIIVAAVEKVNSP